MQLLFVFAVEENFIFQIKKKGIFKKIERTFKRKWLQTVQVDWMFLNSNGFEANNMLEWNKQPKKGHTSAKKAALPFDCDVDIWLINTLNLFYTQFSNIHSQEWLASIRIE